MASTQWRIYITAVQGQGPATIAEIEMHGTIGGANLCTGGTVSSSSQPTGTYAASTAFDGNANTYWYAGVAVPSWIQYTFPVAQDIVEFLIKAPLGGDAIGAPSAFELQYWDGAAWVTTIRRRYEGFTSGQSRTYSASHPTVAKQAWRLYVTATQTGNPGISTLELRATPGGANQAAGGTPSHSSAYTYGYMGDQAFDASSATLWLASAAAPQWLSCKFASAIDIVQYLITAGGGEQARHPKTFKLQYEDGSGNWIDADSRVNEANWINGETRTYSLTPVASARPQVFICT